MPRMYPATVRRQIVSRLRSGEPGADRTALMYSRTSLTFFGSDSSHPSRGSACAPELLEGLTATLMRFCCNRSECSPRRTTPPRTSGAGLAAGPAPLDRAHPRYSAGRTHRRERHRHPTRPLRRRHRSTRLDRPTSRCSRQPVQRPPHGPRRPLSAANRYDVVGTLDEFDCATAIGGGHELRDRRTTSGRVGAPLASAHRLLTKVARLNLLQETFVRRSPRRGLGPGGSGKRSGGAIALLRANIGRLDGSISPHTRISQSYFSTATISLPVLPADIKVVRHERRG